MKIRLFRIILFGLIALANLTKFTLLGTRGNSVQFIICLIIVIFEVKAYKDKKEIKGSKTAYVICGIFAALIVIYFSLWRYGFGKLFGVYSLKLSYAASGGYTTTFFPEKVPEGAKLKDFGHLPTIMQGDGYVYAVFDTEDATLLSKLENEAAAKAIMSFDITELGTGEMLKENLDLAEKIFREKTGFKDIDPTIDFTDPARIRYDHPDHDITIYIIDSNFYFNHLRTDAVLVDHTDGVIEYVGM